MYILKNAPNQYIVFNSGKQTRATLDITPKEAERVRLVFSLTPVSPMQYLQMRLNDYREVLL